MIKLGRDPFARQSIRKSQRFNSLCVWCGRIGRMFNLIIVDDNQPRNDYRSKEAYCSMDCVRAYNS